MGRAFPSLLDLVTVFSRDVRVSGGNLLHYTLIDEKDLALEPTIGASAASNVLKRGLQILAKHDSQKFSRYKSMLG